jgi:hypothetical protein
MSYNTGGECPDDDDDDWYMSAASTSLTTHAGGCNGGVGVPKNDEMVMAGKHTSKVGATGKHTQEQQESQWGKLAKGIAHHV